MMGLNILGVLAFQMWTLCVEILLSSPLIFLCHVVSIGKKQCNPAQWKLPKYFWENVRCNHEISIVIIHSPINDVEELWRLRHLFINVLTRMFSAWYVVSSIGLGNERPGSQSVHLIETLLYLRHCTRCLYNNHFISFPQQFYEKVFPHREGHWGLKSVNNLPKCTQWLSRDSISGHKVHQNSFSVNKSLNTWRGAAC